MTLTMLGSGCWEGVPAPFCNCAVCVEASQNPLSIENRTRPELYVKTDKAQFLIEMSPDLRVQSTRHQLPPISDYVVSHWHFDHLFGLYELDAWIDLVLKKPITIYCSQAAADVINDQFSYISTRVRVVKAFEAFMIGDVKLTPLPVYHMRQKDEGRLPAKLDNTFGYLVEVEGQKIAYLADYYKVPEETLQFIQECDAVIIDGTYLFEDKYPQKPYQQATIEEKDPDHIHGNDIIDFATSLKAKKVYYHSISHLPEATHEVLQGWLPNDQYIGYDGCEIG